MAKYRVNLTVYELKELEAIIRKHNTNQAVLQRAKITLFANGECKRNKDIMAELHIHSADITKWTKRWIDRAQDSVLERLSDLPRPGAPDTFTPEKICQMVARDCEYYISKSGLSNIKTNELATPWNTLLA